VRPEDKGRRSLLCWWYWLNPKPLGALPANSRLLDGADWYEREKLFPLLYLFGRPL
jgi:hypothetical protein